jgi:hypothetical protein
MRSVVEKAIAQLCAFHSPFTGSMSVMAMFQQQLFHVGDNTTPFIDLLVSRT